jgi:hypothetical protein
MTIKTCSGAISFVKELENESAKVYEELAQKYEQPRDMFLSFAKENRKFVTQVERAYYGVITDAIEGCFAFDINPEEYLLNPSLQQSGSYHDTLKQVLAMEEMIEKCYTQSAEQSQYLMADVPRAFKMVAKKRDDRIQKLKSLLSL